MTLLRPHSLTISQLIIADAVCCDVIEATQVVEALTLLAIADAVCCDVIEATQVVEALTLSRLTLCAVTLSMHTTTLYKS